MSDSLPAIRTHLGEPDEVSFHELMASQLQRAPWVALSLLLHATALLLLWLLMPPENRRSAAHRADIQFAESQPVAPPDVPPPLATKTEPTPLEPQLRDSDLPENPDPDDAPDDADAVAATPSAFDSDQWNTSIGLSGGAGARYGNRGSCRGRSGHPGGQATPVAVQRGLDWLRDHQDEDGKWDCDQFMKHDIDGKPCDGPGNGVHDVGVTGLALLAFLGDGSTLRAGAYKEPLKRGVKWLREQQQENGLFGTNSSHDFVYDHAIAAYAMTEAYGLSQYSTLAKNAQQGINYLESHRNPYSVWRYQPRDNDNDTSVTGWCLMAYESGEYFGLEVNKNAIKLVETWLDQVTDQSGRCGYTKAGEPSSRHPGDHATRFPVEKGEAMTAVGLFCRFFMGQDPKEKPVMKAAADLILTKPPIWDPKGGTIDEYYWFYATYALFQMGGVHWTEWSKKLTDSVVKKQREDGNFKGSWDPIGAFSEDGGRVYTTAILVLTLQANYRYAPFTRR